MLSAYEPVRVEIRDVSSADTFGILFENHPAEMCVHQTLANGVRVLLGIGVSVMGTMVSGPPSDGTLNGATSDGSEKVLEWARCRV